MIELKLGIRHELSTKTGGDVSSRSIERMLHENWYEQKANNNIKTSHAKEEILASLTHEKKIERKHFSSQRLVTFQDVKNGEEFVGYLSNEGYRRRAETHPPLPLPPPLDSHQKKK